jgi:thiol:disulfide interchange protein
MARLLTVFGIVAIALFGLFGMQGVGAMSTMDHGSMMEHTGCEDGHCGEPTSTACATHCLSQALDEGIEMVLVSGVSIAAAAVVGLVLASAVRLPLVFQPVAIIRSRDPAWIRSTIRRE